ncbi:DUF5060 domain-containing protein [Flavilitoribacter nigricans]|nr:DUF5060 domain-containing protein [Flavilitoribacter nigricans]
MKNLVTLLFLLMVSGPVGWSQVAYAFDQTGIRTAVFIPVDLSLRVTALPDAPFEVTLGAVFSHEDGASITVPGFYNGEKEFVVRFAPTLVGNWTFETFSSIPDLAGKMGKVQSLPDTDPDQHGPVGVHPDLPQKFIYADSTPYFALAFELDWLFALDYGDPEGIPKTENIIREVKANGFNQVVMNVYAYDVGWETSENVPDRYQYRQPDFSVFGGDNDDPDFSKLNIDFFKHFDRVIDHLQQKGIMAHLMIYVWNKRVNWPPMYSEADNRYFDYIIKRYQAFSNIIWDVSKEALDYGRCDIPYINERIQRIRNMDAYGSLITVHDYEYCSREPDRVDFISIQNWRNDLYSLSLEALLRHPDKPVMNIEHGGYEKGPFLSFQGNYVDPQTCLIRNYECIFAGLYSTYYWQNTSWNIVIYDPLSSEQDFDPPRFDYYRHLQAFFQLYDFNTLFPHKPKLTTNGRVGADNLASSGYALTNGKGRYLYLLPGSNFQTNVVVPEPPGGQLRAKWFNPFTGEFRDGGISEWWNWKAYRSPWESTTSILILDGE